MSVTYLKLGGNHLIRSFNCWVSRPMFMKTVESFWHECCLEHTGRFRIVRKLNLMANKLRRWI
jgi:hypothetical protein